MLRVDALEYPVGSPPAALRVSLQMPDTSIWLVESVCQGLVPLRLFHILWPVWYRPDSLYVYHQKMTGRGSTYPWGKPSTRKPRYVSR